MMKLAKKVLRSRTSKIKWLECKR